jgi:hypothetical protein
MLWLRNRALITVPCGHPSICRAPMQALRVGATRFPGGACSNYWNLSAANGAAFGGVVAPCGQATCQNSSRWCSVDRKVRAAPAGAFATAAFLLGPAAATTESNPVIDLNLLHFDGLTAPALVDAVVAAAAAAGPTVLPLTRWELGNEYYLPSDWQPPQPYGCSPSRIRLGTRHGRVQ